MLNKLIANMVAVMPEKFVWLFSQRYIAGRTLEEAMATSKMLNSKGIDCTVDVLGEYITKKEEAVEYKEMYLRTIASVKENKVEASISVKPTMFGLLLDKDFCYSHIRELIIEARKQEVTICLDMEDSACTDDEIALFQKLYTEFPDSVSFVLQAYLKRTLNDLKYLTTFNNKEYPINIRLCKGIYVEPEDIAFKNKHRINKNYTESLDYMMQHNFYCSIATHDKSLIREAFHLIEKHKYAKSMYEFQMLYGVRPKLRDQIVQKGNKMRIYVPYGQNWFGYSTRRLKENPRMVTDIIKALIIRN
ncbi:MAG: proline dehydrogenase family protein [Bacteroidales bacterium]|nr:proline dehydrogenase family protein [Bacteroidales bacterium]MBN2818501.1 proline dehydrogenase family protein [Bacteroidales bacterium]